MVDRQKEDASPPPKEFEGKLVSLIKEIGSIRQDSLVPKMVEDKENYVISH